MPFPRLSKWAKLDNGALLRAADADFDVLVTTDRNLICQ
jgi:hypothetical protein